MKVTNNNNNNNSDNENDTLFICCYFYRSPIKFYKLYTRNNYLTILKGSIYMKTSHYTLYNEK